MTWLSDSWKRNGFRFRVRVRVRIRVMVRYLIRRVSLIRKLPVFNIILVWMRAGRERVLRVRVRARVRVRVRVRVKVRVRCLEFCF
jgi:hypothetical protein